MAVTVHGSQPSILNDTEVREPPHWPKVSLSEALSWIAFKNSKDCNALNDALAVSPKEDVSAAVLKLAEAIAKLLNSARRGAIELTGVYDCYFSIIPDTASRDLIPTEDYRYFRQFDLIHDGLRRGSGFTGRHAAEGFEWRVEAGSRDAYIQVEVDRAALMFEFRPPSVEPMTDAEVFQWCCDWISSGKGNGEDKAWDVFKLLPRASGLTRDDVFRPQWKAAKTKTIS